MDFNIKAQVKTKSLRNKLEVIFFFHRNKKIKLAKILIFLKDFYKNITCLDEAKPTSVSPYTCGYSRGTQIFQCWKRLKSSLGI